MSERIQTSFYGGMSESLRDPSTFKFLISKHFDIFSDPKRIIPYKTVYANNTGLATDNHTANFLMYDLAVYTLSRLSTASDKVKIYKNTNNGDTWSATSSGVAASASAKVDLSFIVYKGVIFGFRGGGQYIWSYNIGTDTFTDTAKDTGAAGTIGCNGIEGKANGYLYMPQGNVLWQYDGANWTQALLTIPSDEYIVGLANYGNYLAVLTNNVRSTANNAFVYLWDFASSFASEIIEMPSPYYRTLGIAEGELCAISNQVTSEGIKLFVATYGGGTSFSVIWERLTPGLSLVPTITRTVDGKMYFAVNDSNSGRKYQGIWVVGKVKAGYPMAVTIAFDYLESGGTASDIVNFLIEFGFVYICTADYLVHKIAYNGSFASASPVSFLELCKYPSDGGEKLEAVAVSHETLSSMQVALKYLKDEEATFTEIFRNISDNTFFKATDTVELNAKTVTMTVASPCVVSCVGHGFGVNQPIQFSTTGALPTGITAGQTYYVSATSLADDSFKFSATIGGSVVNTSGSQSGVQTCTSLTYELPVYNEVSLRVESLGGAGILGIKFRGSEQETLYG